MLSIDEAITQEREKAEIHRFNSCHVDAELYADDLEEIENAKERCIKCAKEHEQLAERLEELKMYREAERTLDNAYNNGYNKAIDDFSNEIDKYIERYDGTIYDEAYYPNIKSDFEDLKKICNQLKAGV